MCGSLGTARSGCVVIQLVHTDRISCNFITVDAQKLELELIDELLMCESVLVVQHLTLKHHEASLK